MSRRQLTSIFRQQAAAGGIDPELQPLMAELEATRPNEHADYAESARDRRRRAAHDGADRGRPAARRRRRVNVRPVALADAAEWRRMRLALWPDSGPEEVERIRCFRKSL